MNEHVALWPKLALARELPFALAGTQVRPAALEVETDGRIVALEPRVMKVLVALHRAKGHPVSRDEMIDLCWEGRIVTEGALNRCVAQLRKALADNPRIKLDTIATVGYRLQAGADIHHIETAPEPLADGPADPIGANAKPPRWRLRLAVGAGVLALVAATAVGVAKLPRPVTWTVQAYHPLTAEPGMETHPAISPSGAQLVYSQRPDSSVGRDLFIRNTDQGVPVRITTDPGDDHSAAWSPAGDRIAFVRTERPGTCTLLVVPVPVGPERVAARCQSALYTRVSWKDANTLILGDRATDKDLWRIRSVDLTTGAMRDVTTPPADTMGDSDPMVSPDGRHVVFRRTLIHGADDLFLKDFDTGRERALTTDGWKAAGYVWSKDSRHIFYSSNRGGEFGLWTIDTARRGPPVRISLGAGQFTFSRMSIDRRNRLAVESSRSRTNITAMNPDGSLSPITRASGQDWEPRATVDGAVAYISNRTGAFELWVTRPDGQEVRLTNIVGSYLHSPAWSRDGQTLAFVAVKGRKAEIYTVARDGSRLRTVTADGLDKDDPVWNAAGDGLIYLQRTAAGYRMMRLALTPGAKPVEVAGGRDWRELRAMPGGRLFGAVSGGKVVALDGAQLPTINVADIDSWNVGPDGIYVLTGRGRAAPTAWLYPWRGPARRLGEVFTGGDIGVAPDGRVLMSQNLDEQVDLGLFELSAS